jgi:hypothetical protein
MDKRDLQRKAGIKPKIKLTEAIGNLSYYYSNAEQTVKNPATELDRLLDELIIDKSRLEELTDLIVMLADAYAQERLSDEAQAQLTF